MEKKQNRKIMEKTLVAHKNIVLKIESRLLENNFYDCDGLYLCKHEREKIAKFNGEKMGVGNKNKILNR